MHPLLLRYYESELKFMREMGGEFAAEFEKIGAGRLGIERLACADPYVERLLEGFSFLAARVQLKLDAQFPRFSQHLLEMVYPNYLAPTPSMAVVQFAPDATGGTPPDGLTVPRGTVLRSRIIKGEQTACEYRTAHELKLWPIVLSEAEYIPNPGALGALGIPDLPGAQAGLRLRLRTTGGVKLGAIPLDRLPLHLRGGENLPGRLYEQLLVNAIALVVRPAGRPVRWQDVVDRAHLRPLGLDDREALLPASRWGFQGYRLLAEYFAFPERFLFVELGGLRRSMRRCEADEVLEIVVLLNRRESMLERVVDASNLTLFCTPAVNLFTRDKVRVQVDQRGVEYHVVPDRTRPRDFEVHGVTHVTGYDASGQKTREFRPFYSIHDRHESGEGAAYFSLRREPRRLGLRERRTGPRSHYVGSEVFLSLTDPWGGPYGEDVRQLELALSCTNRDLPFHMDVGQGATDFTLESGLPVESVRCVAGPTRPRGSVAEGEAAWRLISQLSLNYLSLLDDGDAHGASALRELLRLYGDPQDTRVQRQIDGIRSVAGRRVVDRVPQLAGEAPMTFARGVEITVLGEDAAFQGGGIVLLASVLEEFFARYVTINSFTKMVLQTVERGEVMRWPARIGRRHAI